MNLEDVAKRVAKRNKATAIMRCPDWGDRQVWQMLFYDPNEEKTPFVGIPQYIFIDSDGAYQLSDDGEAMEYMQSLDDTWNQDDEEIIEI